MFINTSALDNTLHDIFKNNDLVSFIVLLQSNKKLIPNLMYYTTHYGLWELLSLTIIHGGDVNTRINQNLSLLDLAVIKGHLECVEILLHHNVTILINPISHCIKCHKNIWEPPLWYHLRPKKRRRLNPVQQCIKLVIKNELKLATFSLMDAILNNDIVWLENLLQFNPNIISIKVQGYFPLQLASAIGNLQCVASLLKFTNNSLLETESLQAAIEFALINGHLHCYKLLKSQSLLH